MGKIAAHVRIMIDGQLEIQIKIMIDRQAPCQGTSGPASACSSSPGVMVGEQDHGFC